MYESSLKYRLVSFSQELPLLVAAKEDCLVTAGTPVNCKSQLPSCSSLSRGASLPLSALTPSASLAGGDTAARDSTLLTGLRPGSAGQPSQPAPASLPGSDPWGETAPPLGEPPAAPAAPGRTLFSRLCGCEAPQSQRRCRERRHRESRAQGALCFLHPWQVPLFLEFTQHPGEKRGDLPARPLPCRKQHGRSEGCCLPHARGRPATRAPPRAGDRGHAAPAPSVCRGAVPQGGCTTGLKIKRRRRPSPLRTRFQ